MNAPMSRKILLAVELALLALSLVFAAFWIGHPTGNYEPYTLTFAVLLGFLEVGRRRLDERSHPTAILSSILARLGTHRCLYDDWCRQMPAEVADSIAELRKATREDLARMTSEGASKFARSHTHKLVEDLGSYLTSWEKIKKNEAQPNHNSIVPELMRLRVAVASYIREVSAKVGMEPGRGAARILDASEEAEAWLRSASQSVG